MFRNCPEWVVTEQALYSHSMVNVPLYDSLGPDARAFVIKECEMRLIVAFDEVNVRNVLDSAQDCLKVIVTVKDVQPRLVEEADSLGIKIVRFLDIEAAGAESRTEVRASTLEVSARDFTIYWALMVNPCLWHPPVLNIVKVHEISFIALFLR